MCEAARAGWRGPLSSGRGPEEGFARLAHHGDGGEGLAVLGQALVAHRVVHLHGAVDAGALEDDDGLRVDVALDGGGSLDLDALGGEDVPLDAAADDDVTGVDVAGDLALAAEEDLAGAADAALRGSLPLDHPRALGVAG